MRTVALIFFFSLFGPYSCGETSAPASVRKGNKTTVRSEKSETMLSTSKDVSEVKTEKPKTQIVFGVVPQQSPSTVLKNWSAFATKMSELTQLKWVIKTAPSISEFERRCLEGRYDVAYMNPYHYTVFAKKPGYRAFARQAQKRIKGILVVQKEDPAKSIDDLRGYAAAFPSPAAFAASLLTQATLKQKKIPISVNFSNSHDSVYKNVATGIQQVGGGVMRTWRSTKAEFRDKLRILWTSPTYTPHAFAYHPRLSDSLRQRLSSAVQTLSKSSRDPSVFDPIRFKGLEEAKDQDWDDVRALGITILDPLISPQNK